MITRVACVNALVVVIADRVQSSLRNDQSRIVGDRRNYDNAKW